MALQERADLDGWVRSHHVHYEVEPEETTGTPDPQLVGVRIRLLATHEREKLGAPGCGPCAELLHDLQDLADRIATDAGVAERTETIPEAGTLHASSDDPDRDAVALVLRVRCDAPDHRKAGAGEDLCLARVRDRLAELGISSG